MILKADCHTGRQTFEETKRLTSIHLRQFPFIINSQFPDGTEVGQNLASSSDPNAPVSGLVQLWINEKFDYNIESGACNDGKVCGHYTAMVWSTSNKVGCGIKKCPGMGTYLVCDYSPAGNMAGNVGGPEVDQIG